jgi:hypothetical protein
MSQIIDAHDVLFDDKNFKGFHKNNVGFGIGFVAGGENSGSGRIWTRNTA